jgi:hypothetical protein
MKIKATAPAIQSMIDEAPRPSLIVVGAIFDTSFMFSSVLLVLIACCQAMDYTHRFKSSSGYDLTQRSEQFVG